MKSLLLIAAALSGITQDDLKAAHDALAADHPAMAIQAQDRAFVKRERAAYAKALYRARNVRTTEGYTKER